MLQIHYIRISLFRPVFFIGLALVALVACSSNNGGEEPETGKSSGGNPPAISSSSGGGGTSSIGSGFSSSDEGTPSVSSSSSSIGSSSPSLSSSSGGGTSSSDGSNPSGPDDLGIANAIVIKFKSGGEPEIKNNLSEVQITKTGANVVVTAPDNADAEYNFVISGTTSNGSLKFYGDVRKVLYLNGVSITNSAGSAINNQGSKITKKSKRIVVNLVNGTQNFLSDAAGYKCTNFTEAEEQAKGAFFSEGKLEFDGGSGSLDVKGKCNHAIVVDNDFEVKSGKITISESVNDGIHANDIIQVSGGDITIKSAGDAIQSERGSGKVVITGGKINAQTTGIKSHGIACDSSFVSIGGNADVQISVSGNGSKGIRARGYAEFKGNAKTSIQTSGTKHTDPADPEDESNATGIKLTGDLFVEGGELTIKSLGLGAKGVNSDGNSSSIKSSKVDIEADDNGIKVKGTLTIESGTVTVKSKKTKAINAGTLNKKEGAVVNVTDGGS